MPLYEYRCGGCEHQFEALQKMSDDPLVHCPACDEAKLRKLISAVGFRLKGDGWYETDFKTGTKRNIAESTKNKSTENSD
ncbi:MAG: transcriptional regulator [Gammaproteobacteria bacterium]|nr:MAG: transcriptional regulator [Gammaproteobacteria bacterium]